jgi:hypothetical protein
MEVEVYTSWKQQLDLKLDLDEGGVIQKPKVLEVG